MVQQYLLVILMAGLLIFIWRNNQNQKKKHETLMSSISTGDEVVLNSGIHGFVGQVEEKVIWIEVSENVELKVSKSAVAAVLSDKELEEEADSEEMAEDSIEDEGDE